MTLLVALSLFTAMVVLAIIPGPGIMVVMARTLSQGLLAGIVTALGIVAGDFVFIVLAVYGLSALAQTYGELFLIVKYTGAVYLVWLGIKIMLTKSPAEKTPKNTSYKHSTNFIAGLVTTLSNPKAILFYVSFFPAFLDLSAVTYIDFGIIFALTFVAIFGVMASYAYLVHKTGSLLKKSSTSTYIKYGAGATLISSGVYIATRANG